jgi:fibro-slime domain-containing protein
MGMRCVVVSISVLFVVSLLASYASAQVPAPPSGLQSFVITIINRDFQGCQYLDTTPPTTCSDWSSTTPGMLDPNANKNLNQDFECAPRQASYQNIGPPRTVLGVVQNTLGADGTPQWAGTKDVMYTSAASFYEWYHDVPRNLRVYTQATFVWGLDPLGTGKYAYVWDEGSALGPYFPIDARGFGNYCWFGNPPLPPDPPKPYGVTAVGQMRGDPQCYWRIDSEVGTRNACPETSYPGYQHNFHFTDQLEWDFIANSAAGLFIEFNGDDDTWIFINNQLVVDLGGINWTANAVYNVNFNSLSLTDGQAYTVKWFHAQRKVDCSHHTLVTNLFPICRADNEGALCGTQPTPTSQCAQRACHLNRCTLVPAAVGTGCTPSSNATPLPTGCPSSYVCVASTDPTVGGTCGPNVTVCLPVHATTNQPAGPTQSTTGQHHPKLSAGAIAGIVVGSIVGAIALGVIAFLVIRALLPGGPPGALSTPLKDDAPGDIMNNPIHTPAHTEHFSPLHN